MHPYFTNFTTQVMGHRRRQNNLQQRVNSAKRKSNNELRNAISAMQLQFQVKTTWQLFLLKTIWDVEDIVESDLGFLCKSLACNSSPWSMSPWQGQGPKHFQFEFQRGLFFIAWGKSDPTMLGNTLHTESTEQWNYEKSLWGKMFISCSFYFGPVAYSQRSQQIPKTTL